MSFSKQFSEVRSEEVSQWRQQTMKRRSFCLRRYVLPVEEELTGSERVLDSRHSNPLNISDHDEDGFRRVGESLLQDSLLHERLAWALPC